MSGTMFQAFCSVMLPISWERCCSKSIILKGPGHQTTSEIEADILLTSVVTKLDDALIVYVVVGA